MKPSSSSVPCKNLQIRKNRSLRRNRNRRNRRKRSISRYYTSLKSSRLCRKTDDLCSGVTVIDITDMEWSVDASSRAAEVAEWHYQEQIAFWKSKALSLEYENKMLLQHLRNVYAKQTEDYANYMKDQIENGEEEREPVEEAVPEREAAAIPEREPVGKKRREEMSMLYGDKSPKIMGMETAIQLNYELHLEEDKKLPYWPHTPLNLKFE